MLITLNLDDIWEQMKAESNQRSVKRQKTDENTEVAKNSEKASKSRKLQSSDLNDNKTSKDSMEDATAKALEAIRAMKSSSKQGMVKEKVRYAGGSYEIEREKTQKDIK